MNQPKELDSQIIEFSQYDNIDNISDNLEFQEFNQMRRDFQSSDNQEQNFNKNYNQTQNTRALSYFIPNRQSISELVEKQRNTVSIYESVYKKQFNSDMDAKIIQTTRNNQERSEVVSMIAQTSRVNNKPQQSITIFNPQKMHFSTDWSEFLLKPIEKNQIIQLTITKTNSFLSSLYPRYDLTFSTNPEINLCSAKQQPFNQYVNYLISSDKEVFSRQNKSCLGKLRGNQNNSIFKLFDRGDNPEKKVFLENTRQEFAYIQYSKTRERHILQSKVSVVIPNIVNNKQIQFKPLNNNQGLYKAFNSLDLKQNIIHLTNKFPKFNQEQKTYTMGYNKRVTMNSIDNLILVPIFDQHQSQFLLQLGKFQQDKYNLDVTYPLSILQAFAISISQFESKLK